MQFSTLLQFVVLAGLVQAAPVDINARDAVSADDHLLGVLDLEAREPRIPLGPSSTTTTKATSTAKATSTTMTTKVTTMTHLPTATTQTVTTANTGTGIFTSVPASACPTSVNTNPGQPDFNLVPTSCGQSWLDIVNMWRRAYNKPTFTWSAHAASVAYGAAYNASGGAKPFVHSDLGYWGTDAEVESPGYQVPFQPMYGMTPFGSAIANWMCEVPSDPQLKTTGFTGIDLCTTIVRNTDYIGETPGETGHHDVLLGDYSQIGCAFVFNQQNPTGPFAGLYVCDFLF